MNYLKQQLDEEIIHHTRLGVRLSGAHDVVQNITKTVASKAAGLFVLAKLYMNYLTKTQSLDSVLEVLDRLPEHEEEYFDDIMAEVDSQGNEADKSLAYHALASVATACRETPDSLTFGELIELLHICTHQSRLKLTKHRVLSVTKGFLAIEETAVASVKPFHISVETYLYENCHERFAHIGLDMASLCLDTLTNAVSALESADEHPSTVMDLLDSRPFLRYALQHWGQHVASNTSGANEAAAIRFITEQYELSIAVQKASLLAMGDNDLRYGWPGSSALHICAWFGLGEILPTLLGQSWKSKINRRDALTGRTPLHVASIRGHAHLVELFFRHGADPLLSCNRGATPLWEAVKLGHASVVSSLLTECNAHQRNDCTANSRNASYGDQTPLMLAITEHRDEIGEKLISHPHFIPDLQDRYGRTALHLAAYAGHALAVRKLAQRQDFSRFADTSEYLAGRTSLMLLLESARWSDVSAFCATEDEYPKSERLDLIMTLHTRGASLGATDARGRTLLHYAALRDEHVPILEFLLKNGLHVNKRDDKGMTALHFAAASAWMPTHTLSTLLDHAADRTIRDKEGRTAYDIAEVYRLSQDVKESLNPRPDVPLLETDGQNVREAQDEPLWARILFDPHELLQSRFDGLSHWSKAQIEKRDPLGSTLLHCAVLAKSCAIVELLLADERTKLSVHAADIHGQTPLQLALSQLAQPYQDNPLYEIVNQLLPCATEYDLDRVDLDGRTVLDTACSGCHVDIALDLITGPSYTSIPAGELQSLFGYAVENDRTDAVKRTLAGRANVFSYRRTGKLPSQVAAEKWAGEKVQALLRDKEAAELSCLAATGSTECSPDGSGMASSEDDLRPTKLRKTATLKQGLLLLL